MLGDVGGRPARDIGCAIVDAVVEESGGLVSPTGEGEESGGDPVKDDVGGLLRDDVELFKVINFILWRAV